MGENGKIIPFPGNATGRMLYSCFMCEKMCYLEQGVFLPSLLTVVGRVPVRVAFCCTACQFVMRSDRGSRDLRDLYDDTIKFLLHSGLLQE